MSEPKHMWPYWRDKKGIDEAIENHFSDTFADDEELLHAWAQFKFYRKAIDNRMAELEAIEAEEDRE